MYVYLPDDGACTSGNSEIEVGVLTFPLLGDLGSASFPSQSQRIDADQPVKASSSASDDPLVSAAKATFSSFPVHYHESIPSNLESSSVAREDGDVRVVKESRAMTTGELKLSPFLSQLKQSYEVRGDSRGGRCAGAGPPGRPLAPSRR